MKSRLIVFDLDGVLFDSVAVMHEYTLIRFPAMTQEDAVAIHAGNFYAEIKKGEWIEKEALPEEIENRVETYTKKKLGAPMYAGMKELIEELAKHATLVVNTSAALDRSLPLLEREKIDDLFALVATRELHESKVEKFKLIAETFKIAPEEMLFITDTLGDLHESGELNIPTIAVTWGVHDRSYFERELHGHLIEIVDTPDELAQILNAQ